MDAVLKDRPAARAGMQKGDIITAIQGKPVTNIYDYMNRLNEFEKGQVISVEILRGVDEKIVIVQL